MAATRGLGTTGDGAGTVTPLDHKLAQSGLLTKQGALNNLVRSGLFWDAQTNIVVGRGNMAYDVRPFTAALSRGAAAGTVLLANDGVTTVSTTAAPGSNSRIDVIYVWQREFSLDGVNSAPVIGVVQGTPAASPSVPSLAAFPGAIALAQAVVPAGVTATNSGVTITQLSRFTAAAGGVVYFRNITERDEVTAALPNGTLGFVETTGTLWLLVGGVWVVVYEDTGWTNVSSFSNSFSAGDTAPAYKRINDVVYLSGDLYRASAPSSLLAFTLPAGYRPRATITFGGNVAWSQTVTVRINGEVSVNANLARTSSPGYSLGQVQFPADN